MILGSIEDSAVSIVSEKLEILSIDLSIALCSIIFQGFFREKNKYSGRIPEDVKIGIKTSISILPVNISFSTF